VSIFMAAAFLFAVLFGIVLGCLIMAGRDG